MKMKSALLLALVFSLIGATPAVRAQTTVVEGAPAYVDYQGTVYDGTNTAKPLGSAPSGSSYIAAPTNYTMQFRIYSTQSGGTPIYAETQTVTVSLGQFSVRLGSGAPITSLPGPGGTPNTSIADAFSAKDRYLELTVIVPPSTTGTPITPRLAFQSSPFSFVAQRAKAADSVNGVVNATGASTFTGTVNATGGSFTGTVNATGGTSTVSNFTVTGPAKINANNTLEFGGGIAGKEGSAGKIGYNALSSNALDIVGAGTSGTNRLLKIWAEGGTTFTGPINGTDGNFSGAVRGASGSFSGAITGGSGSFSGAITGSSGNFSGAITGGTGSFSGDVSINGSTKDLKLSGPYSGIFVNSPEADGSTCIIKARHLDAATYGSDYTDGLILDLRSTGNTLFAFASDGTAYKPNGGSWATTSDIRLKENVEDLHGALEKVLQLRSVTFDYKDPKKYSSGRKNGFIAQEVEKIFPNWISESPDGFKMISVTGFESLTVQALRELRLEKDQQLATRDAEIGELKKRLTELDARDKAREERLARVEQTLAR